MDMYGSIQNGRAKPYLPVVVAVVEVHWSCGGWSVVLALRCSGPLVRDAPVLRSCGPRIEAL